MSEPAARDPPRAPRRQRRLAAADRVRDDGRPGLELRADRRRGRRRSQRQHRAVTLAGLAGLVGGAFSMATGEYVSVQSQNESAKAEIEVERHELKHNAEAELAELTQMYVDRGVEPRPGREGGQPALPRSRAGAVDPCARGTRRRRRPSCPARGPPRARRSCRSSVGALLPAAAVPVRREVARTSRPCLPSSRCSAPGRSPSRFTVRGWFYSGMRQLLLGALAAAVTFGVGGAFGATVG